MLQLNLRPLGTVKLQLVIPTTLTMVRFWARSFRGLFRTVLFVLMSRIALLGPPTRLPPHRVSRVQFSRPLML